MTCKDCFHCKACDMIYESCTHKSVEGLDFPDDAEFCEHFKHINNVVEVVRCKDCHRCGVYTSGKLYCKHQDGLTDPKPDDFCSYGERREGE